MKRIWYIIICLFLFAPQVYAKNWTHTAHDGTIGGTSGKLDNIDQCNADGAGYDLQDKDSAIVWGQANSRFLFYIYDGDSETAESDPTVVAPDYCDEPGAFGAGRWILSGVFAQNLAATTYGSNGSITDEEFLYINTLSSNAQTQISSKEGTLTNSAGLLAALSDETGTGLSVFNTAPVFITSLGIGSAILDETELEILDGATLSTTQLNYLNAATGTTGTTSTNLVYSTSPVLVTPTLGAATATSLTIDASATPGWVFRDSDNLGTDKEIAKIYANALTVTDGAEDGGLYLQVMDGGGESTGIAINGLTTEVDLAAFQLVTTGDIMGGVNVSPKAGAYTVGTDDANETHGTLFINSDVADITLAGTVGVVGASGCIYQGAGVTGIMQLEPGTGSHLVYNGVEMSDGAPLASAGAATDRICWVGISADHWLITSATGTWGE